MQKTSALFKRLFLDRNHWTDTRLNIAGVDYGESSLIEMKTFKQLFQNEIKVGSCIAGEINITLEKPEQDIPRQAKLSPFIRLNNGKEQSEWLPKSVFFIDQREYDKARSGKPILHIIGYDAMLKTEQAYPESSLDWPAKDIDVVREIAKTIGVEVDPETVAIINKTYLINLPTEYTCREVLGYIGGMYAGCWIINNDNQLRLVTINSLPAETKLLVDESGNRITFGGVRINV